MTDLHRMIPTSTWLLLRASSIACSGLCLLLLLAGTPVFAGPMEFITDPAKVPAGDARPRVIIFGSTSCGWCRKLAADTLTHATVAELADKFVWLKIDVDEHPALATKYGVTGLPNTIMTDAAGNVLGEQAGYLPAAEYVAFLEKTLANPQTTASDLAKWLADLKAGDEPLRREAARKVLRHVSRVDGPGRDQTISALKEQGVTAWCEFAPYLSHPRLAVRAAAGGLLQRASVASRDFDPFAEKALREEQSLAWKAWMESQGGVVPLVSFVDLDADATAWSPEGNRDRPPAPPLSQPLETTAAAL